MTKEKVFFITGDGWEICADFYPADSDKAVILLHQARRDKSSMTFLAERLNSEGYNVLAPDFRGHGESQGNYEEFSEDDYQNMFFDTLAADEYLHKIKPEMQVQMIGASIGANTALRFQEMNTLHSVIVLSPGFNYHGIDPVDANLGNIACPIFYINAEGDASAAETKQLYQNSSLTEGDKKLMIYPGRTHGVDILTENPQVLEDVVSWLKKY